MEQKQIKTSIGAISTRINNVAGTIPVIFLHGVYYDHNLWKYQVERLTDRTVITVDMPFHGSSKNITKKNWTLDDCALMLLEILDALKIDKVIAIGHSWGSMTILRAAAKAPERFQSIGLCNMPSQAATTKTKLLFKMQHLMLGFRKFYAIQVAKTLYGKEAYTNNPSLLSILESSMSKLASKEIIQTDESVIINAENAEPIIQSLKVPALALKGKEDYVLQSKQLKTKIVAGGHVSPIEVPDAVYVFIAELIKKNNRFHYQLRETMKQIELSSESGLISATVFEGITSDHVLIIASATGVKQEFYWECAQFMAQNGITVITFDYFGIGRSLKTPIREIEINAADWGRNDLESVIQYVISTYPLARKAILGHSIGGQLIGLSKSSKYLDKIILVAAQSGYWKFWEGAGKLKMWFNWHILFPALTTLFGFLPSKRISGMENLPKNVANQWSKWGKNSSYLASDHSIKELFFKQIDSDVIAYSIEDDQFAPEKAVKWMTERYTNAKTKFIHLRSSDYQTKEIGHFGIFKNRFKNSIWEQFLREIK